MVASRRLTFGCGKFSGAFRLAALDDFRNRFLLSPHSPTFCDVHPSDEAAFASQAVGRRLNAHDAARSRERFAEGRHDRALRNRWTGSPTSISTTTTSDADPGENSVVARYRCLECDQIEEFQQLLIEHGSSR
jgi:hypothetical protein